MEYKYLQTFLVASETMNFTKTAAKLQYAQSSVTAQIKSLEQDLETPLFERLGKRLVLTQAGKQLKRYAHQIVHLTDEARTAIDAGEKTGTIIVGAQESQCTYRLPELLKKFKSKYPLVHLIFKPAHSDESATASLLQGELDLAFIMDTNKPHPYLEATPLLQEKLILVASPANPLASKATVQPDDLQEETILLTEKGCSYRNLFEQKLYEYQTSPKNTIEFVSLEAIKKCVIANLGIAMLPEMTVAEDLKEGSLAALHWDVSMPLLTTQMALHKNKWLSPQLDDFVNLTKMYFAEEVRHPSVG
ncbi:LysR family transcriptional regulator [Virgibacillus sp. NKC19-3]|uniref:LysR family transcriptional regulator n=1 Tax=Virgibacillus saliphilus TaxID=2831674 RepID=UPI001C9A4EED|nr:LysR family transcriptional regulator [Virgibacillus sp. NKC19-3]MBY7141941.1 LysR family transcriptional regulator [Virgibacillus sp. NKC19-3]